MASIRAIILSVLKFNANFIAKSIGFLEETFLWGKYPPAEAFKNLLAYYAVRPLIEEDFDNVAFGQIVTMTVSEHFLHTKQKRTVFEIRFFMFERKARNSPRSRSKRAGGKKRLMKAIRSSSHVSIVHSLSLSNHVFASPRVKWLPLIANSFAVSGIMIAEPGVKRQHGQQPPHR
ncbi:hypothetical protein Tco_0573877 [Tanacetum coccineum]